VVPETLSCTVVVPTYRRVPDLARCLAALELQDRPAEGVVVVCRDTDDTTREYLAGARHSLPLKVLLVAIPGQVAALNVALAAVSTDIVAITDDDAAPYPDWLVRIERHYLADAAVGCVGGRDYVAGCEEPAATGPVGRVSWFGRTIGRHHLGCGPARCVDFLKGANLSFRRSAIGELRFDERLRGSGAQVHNDLAFTLALRRRGWKVVYDPAVAVDHYPGVRFDLDRRDQRSEKAVMDRAYNETLTLLEYLPWPAGIAFLVWAIAAGKRDAPGLLVFVRLARFDASRRRELIGVIASRLAAAAAAGRRGPTRAPRPPRPARRAGRP
jgi:GT2 family glycosyltransferase